MFSLFSGGMIRGNGMRLRHFIPALTPEYTEPAHLGEYVDLLDVADRQEIKVVVHAPPRHGKTETALHAVPLWLLRNPKLSIAYVTYGSELSYSKSRDARDLARAAGVRLDPEAQGIGEWRTVEGGRFLATGVKGALTGQGFDVILVDDPYKNRLEAESAAHRDRVWDLWTGNVINRLEPGGSVVVFATRWHPDDLSGRLIQQGWRYLRLPAIRDDGRPLWPERWTLEALQERRSQVGEYNWTSMFQGVPRVRGGRVFSAEPGRYTRAMLEDLRHAIHRGIGVDLAYTVKTSSDFSAAVVMLEAGAVFFVLEVVRKQCRPEAFAAILGGLQAKHRTGRARWYTGGQEAEIARLLSAYGARIDAVRAGSDKFLRAQPYAATWNAGRVLVPDVPEDEETPEWLDPFIGEHLDFTGIDDLYDDQVDAGAAAHDLIASGGATTLPAPTVPRPPAPRPLRGKRNRVVP